MSCMYIAYYIMYVAVINKLNMLIFKRCILLRDTRTLLVRYQYIYNIGLHYCRTLSLPNFEIF